MAAFVLAIVVEGNRRRRVGSSMESTRERNEPSCRLISLIEMGDLISVNLNHGGIKGGAILYRHRDANPIASPPALDTNSFLFGQRMNNLFADLPTTLDEELVSALAENRHVRIERIVSTGHASPESFWYDQDEHEWVIVLKGQAKLVFGDGKSVQMQSGDHLLIPAHCRHRVEWTKPDEPTVWLAVFYRD